MASYGVILMTGGRILAEIASGFLATKFQLVYPRDIQRINKYVFKICYIPLVMRFLMTKKISQLDFSPLAVGALGSVITQATMLLTFLFPIKNPFRTYLGTMFPAVFVNYVIVGMPFFTTLWGEAEKTIISVITVSNDIVTVPLYLLQCSILRIYEANKLHEENGEQKEKLGMATILKILKGIFSSPIIIGDIIGFVFALLGIPNPVFVERLVNILANTVIALSLFCVGGFLAQHSIIACPWPQFVICLLLRHVYMPAILAVLCHLFNFTARVSKQVVVLGALPTASSCFMLAEDNGVGSGVASTMIFWSVIFCIPAIIAWLAIFEKLGIFVE